MKRPFALSVALLASAQLVTLSTPAFAQGPDTSPSGGTTQPAPAQPPSSSAPSGAAPAGTGTAPSDTGAPSGAAPAAPATTEGTVEVHVESSVKVNLERRSGEGAPWEFACESPCDQRLSATDQYHVVGTGLNDSKPFYLDSTKGDKITLNILPGDKRKSKIGMYILIGGAVFLVTGIIIIAAGSSNHFESDGSLSGSRLNAVALGTTFGIVGIAGGLFGTAWWLGNQASRVGGDVTKPQPARGSLPPSTTAGLRTPDVTPAAFTVPLFSRSF